MFSRARQNGDVLASDEEEEDDGIDVDDLLRDDDDKAPSPVLAPSALAGSPKLAGSPLRPTTPGVGRVGSFQVGLVSSNADRMPNQLGRPTGNKPILVIHDDAAADEGDTPRDGGGSPTLLSSPLLGGAASQGAAGAASDGSAAGAREPEGARCTLTIQKAKANTAVGIGTMNRDDDAGVLVVAVNAGSLAGDAGLVVGDVILSINGEAVKEHIEFARLCREAVGQVVLELLKGAPATAKGAPTVAKGAPVISPLRLGATAAAGGGSLAAASMTTITLTKAKRSSVVGVKVSNREGEMDPHFGNGGSSGGGDGVIVVAVTAGSLAAGAGLNPGDVILNVNGNPVGDHEKFTSMIKAAEGTVSVGILALSQNSARGAARKPAPPASPSEESPPKESPLSASPAAFRKAAQYPHPSFGSS